jgi:hypothetical protein
MAPINISSFELIEVRAVDDEKVGWTGGFFPYGGLGLYRLRHHLLRHRPGRAARASHRYRRGDPVHPQGERELRLDESTRPMAAGDVAVLQEGVARDLVNTGTEALEMIGFFSGPAVNQRWGDVVLPGNSRLTGSPNVPE